MSTQSPVPAAVAQLVERYVDEALAAADRYENSTPLDESGVWDLHRLAAEVYEQGFAAGAQVQAIREQGQRQRRRDGESRDKVNGGAP